MRVTDNLNRRFRGNGNHFDAISRYFHIAGFAASCILPLTSRIDLRAKYGTRHRAAIGLSEIKMP